ncbi:MAG: enoyl-CoA hydratase/isomerase family protein [Bacillota bacterium]
MTRQSDILCKVEGGVGWIKLNRPQAHNALSFEMIEILYKTLLQWKNDDHVAFICLEGEGDQALCSGGDVRALYDLRNGNVKEYAFKFFSTEYRMNMTMHRYSKPILVYMNGYVMGGGVGIAVGDSHRIVTEKTKWAMPEMDIGLYPDVGGSYFLPKMPGYIGRYLSLTSKTIRPEDALYIGAADYYMDSSSWLPLKEAIKEQSWSVDTAKDQLDELLNRFQQVSSQPSTIAQLEEKINCHFRFSTVEEIVASLEAAAKEGDEWAAKTIKTICKKSPTSLKVTLQQLINGKEKSMLECFEMELEMSMNFMKSHDFFEGVRSVLVDKDRSPKWNPDTLEKVTKEDVDSFFRYEWAEGKNPLQDFDVRNLL